MHACHGLRDCSFHFVTLTLCALGIACSQGERVGSVRTLDPDSAREAMFRQITEGRSPLGGPVLDWQIWEEDANASDALRSAFALVLNDAFEEAEARPWRAYLGSFHGPSYYGICFRQRRSAVYDVYVGAGEFAILREYGVPTAVVWKLRAGDLADLKQRVHTALAGEESGPTR